jgi:hypothetical protein
VNTDNGLTNTDYDRQMTDPTSRQRGLTNWTGQKISYKEKEKKYIYISGHGPQMGLDTKTYWLADRQSQCDLDLDLDLEQASKEIAKGSS